MFILKPNVTIKDAKIKTIHLFGSSSHLSNSPYHTMPQFNVYLVHYITMCDIQLWGVHFCPTHVTDSINMAPHIGNIKRARPLCRQ